MARTRTRSSSFDQTHCNRLSREYTKEFTVDVAILFMANILATAAIASEDQSGFGFVILRTHTHMYTRLSVGPAHAHYANTTPASVSGLRTFLCVCVPSTRASL